jgi:general secretion pathway protein G
MTPVRTASRESGLTLVETLVVLVIIAVVAAMVIPNVIGRPDEARVTVARADLQGVSSALKMYRLDNGTYPTTAQGLAALVTRPTAGPAPANWHAEGYLAALPVDPWGRPYVYRSPGESGPFDLLSLGADGAPGGEGLDADIVAGAR